MTPLIAVRDLHVSYGASDGARCASLAGVSFTLEAGETLGVLGESGSGKSTLARALLGMLPGSGKVSRGTVHFEGRDLLQARPRELEKIRGERIALIFQEPSLALHPAMRVAEQVSDVIAAHKSLPRGGARKRAQEILATVFGAETGRIAESYPHQLSGGQRARVLIAQAISCGPALIVADEPTASLDPETQQEILATFRTLRQEFQLSLIWITHNPGLLAGFADRVLLLYAGRVVEMGTAASVLSAPQHPYTQALLRCAPPALGGGNSSRKGQLAVIAGEPAGSMLEAGKCSFAPRCDERMDVCEQREPGAVQLSGGHEVCCFKHGG